MITNKDIEKLKETFATKEDLEQFATKEDLEQFATKKEMNKRFKETNRHFDVVAEDLKNSIALLAEQISAKNIGSDEHEKSHETLKTDVSILKTKMTAVEAKIGK